MPTGDSIQSSGPLRGQSTTLTVIPPGGSPIQVEDDRLPHVGGWKRAGFLLMNLWLVFHLFAILVGPASADPASPLVQSWFDAVAPYLHALYLDHGFRFFVPEPGASTLVSYRLEMPDGSSQTGQFPDPSITPRLYYHRHFMLSEFLGNTDEELQPYIERAFARNLCRQTGAIRVTLTRVTHDVPSIDDVRNGMKLNDPSLFTEKTLGTYTPEELNSPIALRPKNEDSPANSDDPPSVPSKVLP